MACRLGVEVAIVVGSRNFFCGSTWVTATGLDRTTAYHIRLVKIFQLIKCLNCALYKA
jgi:hypothetical protein